MSKALHAVFDSKRKGARPLSEKIVREMMAAADTNSDGEIDLDEFKTIMRSGASWMAQHVSYASESAANARERVMQEAARRQRDAERDRTRKNALMSSSKQALGGGGASVNSSSSPGDPPAGSESPRRRSPPSPDYWPTKLAQARAVAEEKETSASVGWWLTNASGRVGSPNVSPDAKTSTDPGEPSALLQWSLYLDALVSEVAARFRARKEADLSA